MSVLDQTPRYLGSDAVRLARDYYGLVARATRLPSERDQNFLLETGEQKYVLKIANAADSPSLIEAQNAMLRHLERAGVPVPRLVSARDGQDLVYEPGGHLVRLVTWLPGVPLGELPHHSPALLEDVGRRVGELNAALASFDYPALHRDFHWDLVRAAATTARWLPLVQDVEWRSLIEREVAAIQARLDPALPRLRRSIVHNDANDYNVIVEDPRLGAPARETVAGLIDLGDALFSIRIADAAVAIAYAVLGKPDPVSAAASIVAGHHRANPFDDEELAALFDLVKLRLCLSVAVAAHQQPQRPGDAYLGVSQQAIRATLPALVDLHPRLVETALRHACGVTASPRASRIREWLQTQTAASTPIVDGADAPTLTSIDLSVASPLVSGDSAGNAEPELTARVFAMMREAGAAVAAGGYREARTLYATPLFSGDAGERRTVHLGVDFFAPAGTRVFAPLEGVVSIAAENAQALDYGPLVILEHSTDRGETFYTLYGHLSRESLAEVSEGKRIGAGETIGTLGTADVNGGWTPHLHFQIITDLLDMGRDFPGVCSPSREAAWAALCPDPNLLLKLPVLSADDRARVRGRPHIGSSVKTSYREPLEISRGWKQYLFDGRGRRYLDAYNNVPHVGHSHPAVADAVAAQMRVLNTNTRYLHASIEALGARLAATLPAPLETCYFVNSGSEANELALRLARAHTQRRDAIVLDAAYHGNTTTLIDISPYKFNGPGGGGPQPWVLVAPLPDPCRGRYARRPDPGALYARDVADIVTRVTRERGGVAAFIAETAPSVGGQILLPAGFLQRVYESVRAAGGVCIADEVQTAYGRMGSHFYAFEAHHVVPDIVVLGKPIGNGFPIGAVVTTREIAASFDNGMEFFSTFGGSTVSCAAAHAVLDVVERERLQAHAQAVGTVLLESLRRGIGNHPAVADVRGSGLFIGVDIVRDRESSAPDAAAASYVVERLKDERILIGTDGPHHNVLKVRPPMPFDRADAELIAVTIARVLEELPDR
jgi:4-aminobutyrate aminotransferase-like enzyme/Ser/Thr protein kinase RdoA (MazF antagonist)